MGENKKISLLRIISVALALVLAVVILAVVIDAALSSDPLVQVSRAAKNSARALSESDMHSEVYDVAHGGSVGIYWNLQTLTEQLAGYGMNLGVSCKIYTDSKDDAYLMDAVTFLEGEEFIDATVYIDPKKVVASSSSIFDDDSYGINLKKFNENFEGSAFGENGAYSLGEDARSVLETVEDYMDKIGNVKDFGDDTAEICEELFTVLMKSADKNANISKQAGSVDFADGTVKTTDVIISFGNEAWWGFIADIVKHLDKSQEIENYIEKYVDAFGEAYGISVDDVLEKYRTAIDEAVERTDELGQYMEDTEAELIVSISKANKEIVGINLEIDESGKKSRMNLICGPTWQNISEFRIAVSDSYQSFEISYITNENTKQAFNSEFAIVKNQDETLKAVYAWDKEEDEFEAVLDVYGDHTFGLEGRLDFTGKRKSVTFDSIEVDGQTIEIGGLVISVDTNDRMPSAGKYTDILTMSDIEVEAVIGEIRETVQELRDDFTFAMQ